MEKVLEQILNKMESMESGITAVNSKMESMEERLNARMESMENRLGSLESEVKIGFEDVNRKLDTIYAQVAHNTEQEIKLNDLATRVESLETDNKLIKKIVSNQ